MNDRFEAVDFWSAVALAVGVALVSIALLKL